MKKNLLAMCLFFALPMPAQQTSQDIIRSTRISEIENFLRTAHPEDPRRIVLKSRLITLKNAAWMQRGRSSYAAEKAHMPKNPPKGVQQISGWDEEAEFRELKRESEHDHQQKTVRLLNQLFDNDAAGDRAILLVQNRSSCNTIVRLAGPEVHAVAVAAHGENSVVVKKGNYVLRSKVCNAPYTAPKNIVKNMLVSLDAPAAPPMARYAKSGAGISN